MQQLVKCVAFNQLKILNLIKFDITGLVSLGLRSTRLIFVHISHCCKTFGFPVFISEFFLNYKPFFIRAIESKISCNGHCFNPCTPEIGEIIVPPECDIVFLNNLGEVLSNRTDNRYARQTTCVAYLLDHDDIDNFEELRGHPMGRHL